MAEVSRRRLLGSALGTAGAAAGLSLLPPNLQRAVAQAPRDPGSLDDIEHVVILMLENRSFDHYFGTMHGVRGFDDPDAATLPSGRSVFYQPDPKNPDGYLLPFHLDTHTTSAQAIPSTSHAWSVQHAAVNGGKMDNWLPAHRAADGDKRGPYTMGYYERDDIPFHFALAESFTVCDAYHCSLLGPTWPNRLYHWTGTIDPAGRNGGPVTSNVIPAPFRWTTYPERLTEAGVSWHVYQEQDDYGCNPLEFFQAYQDASPGDPLHEHGLTISPPGAFARDAREGRLPTVSWIIPTSPQSEHPDYLPATGADFLAAQLDAVAADPELWRKTVFIVNYDENDGLFDHVVPPMPAPGTPDEFVDGVPIGAGIRVPCVIVSPWTVGGFVASESFDHTSVLQFLEVVTGVREPNISDWRRSTFGDLTSALNLSRPRPAPRLPQTRGQLWRAEWEVATLPPPTFPGADQQPPHQAGTPGPHRVPAPPATPHRLPGALPYTRSRIVENATNHRGDFPHGTKGSNFPGIQDAVPTTAPTSGTYAYASTIVSSRIVVLDPDTHEMVASVRAGANPFAVVGVPAVGKVYAGNSGASDVSVLDTALGRIVGSITVGLSPHGMAASPDGSRVFVAATGPGFGTNGSRTVSVIDTASDTVEVQWSTGSSPLALAVSPDGDTLYTACADGVFALETKRGAQRAELPELAHAQGLAVHPDGRLLYVADTAHGTLAVVDARSHRVRERIRVGRSPWQVALSADGDRAYVTCANDDVLAVVDTTRGRLLRSVTVGHVPTGVAVRGETVWVTTNAAGTVDVVDSTSLSLVASTPMGLSTAPAGITFA
jgi:phospholipase C